MASWKDVVAIGRTLPGVDVATWYGTPGLKVGGKGFARWRTEDDDGLMLLCSQEDKALLLASGEAAYYTTPHYGYGSILVRLPLIQRDALRDLILQAWRIKAPRTMGAAFEPVQSSALPPTVSRKARRPVSRQRKVKRSQIG